VVVCIITGHGLKDPERVLTEMPQPLSVKPNMKDILKHMEF